MKARWELDGHKTPSPEDSTHAGVASRESVRIAFTHGSLNDLDMFSGDTMGTCLQFPISENYCITCGPEFGVDREGKSALVIRAICCEKAAGKIFHDLSRL